MGENRRTLVAAMWASCCCRAVGELLLPLCGRAFVAAMCGSMVLMNVTFASSRKVAKKGVDVNVHVEEAASDRELRGLREMRELLRLVIRKCSGTRGAYTDDSVGP